MFSTRDGGYQRGLMGMALGESIKRQQLCCRLYLWSEPGHPLQGHREGRVLALLRQLQHGQRTDGQTGGRERESGGAGVGNSLC